MYIKASISLDKLSDFISKEKNFVKKSKAGNLYLPINKSISDRPDVNGNNVKLSVFSNDNEVHFLGAGTVPLKNLKDFIDFHK